MWWWEQIAPVKSSEGFASGTKQESIGYADALPSARRESRTREWGVGGKFEGLERGGTTRAEALSLPTNSAVCPLGFRKPARQA